MSEPIASLPAEKAKDVKQILTDLRNSTAVMVAAPLGMGSVITAIEVLADAVEEIAAERSAVVSLHQRAAAALDEFEAGNRNAASRSGRLYRMLWVEVAALAIITVILTAVVVLTWRSR